MSERVERVQISIDHQKKLNKMPQGMRTVYNFGLCGLCKIRINGSDLEWCIDNKFLPVCVEHREIAQERVQKLWGYMHQLNLL